MLKKLFHLRTFALGLSLSVSLLPAIWSANVFAISIVNANILD